MQSSRCVLLFTKPARPGRVKTRLIGELSAAEAASLHQAFLDDLMTRLLDGNFELKIAWALDQGQAMPAGSGPGLVQEGADLGERLYRGLRSEAAEYDNVMAIGSDHPELSLDRVEEGFERLESGDDVVIGPADDGGYYLIGVSSQVLDRAIFEGITWSSPEVLSSTLERCEALALRVSLLAVGTDVDTADDLARLAANLAGDHESCPRTRELLARWGRLEGLS